MYTSQSFSLTNSIPSSRFYSFIHFHILSCIFISVHVHSISKRLILANRVALFLQVPSSHNCQICCAGIVVTQSSLLIDSNVGAFESKEQSRIMHKNSEKRLVSIPLACYCLVLRVVKQIVCVFLSRGSENSSLRSPRLCMSKMKNEVFNKPSSVTFAIHVCVK